MEIHLETLAVYGRDNCQISKLLQKQERDNSRTGTGTCSGTGTGTRTGICENRNPLRRLTFNVQCSPCNLQSCHIGTSSLRHLVTLVASSIIRIPSAHRLYLWSQILYSSSEAPLLFHNLRMRKSFQQYTIQIIIT